jgi:hypothetical protein
MQVQVLVDILTSTDWTTFNNKQPALGFTPANSTITINTTSPLQGGGDLSNNRTLSILSASDSQSGIVTTTSQLFGGSKVFKNRVTVDSVLTLNTTTAIPNQILGINTVGNVNSVGKLSLGAGLSITSSTLLADTNLLITRYDTASMLTNYLQSGVAASTYQTKLTNPVTGTGTLNYIPKFTITGSIIGDANLFTNGNRFVQNEGDEQSFGWDKMINTSSPFFGNNVKAGSTNERIQRTASTTLFNPSAIIFGYQRVNNSSGAVSFGGINFMTTSGNPSGDINPIDSSRMFIEPRGNIGIGTMQPSYKFDIRGTLNATGATTLGSTLAVTGAVTLSTTSATPTSLLGKDGSNVVGTVTTVAQTGLMKAGSVTQNTSSVGIISVAHGLSYEPTQVIVTLAQQNSYIVVCHDITATTLFFTVYDSVTGNPLNNISVGIFWLAIK